MAVNDAGEVAGSVSGGCVEGAVVTEGLELLESGERHLTSFGYSDDDAFAVGLTCGGTVHLYLDPWTDDEVHAALVAAVDASEPVALVTVTEGPHTGSKLLVRVDGTMLGSLGNDELDRIVGRDAVGSLAAGRNVIRHYGPCGEAREDDVMVFVESFAPPPRMVIFGAVDFTASLASA